MSSDQALAESKNIESSIQDKEGIILKSEKPSPKTLAYPIKRQGSGFFGVLEFQLEPEHLGELRKKLQKDSKIIRYMVTIKNPAKIQKEKRVKKKPLVFSTLFEAVKENVKNLPAQAGRKTNKKADLKEIEKELNEILSE